MKQLANFPHIKTNYGLYETLMAHKKRTQSAKLLAAPPKGSRKREELREPLTHPEGYSDVEFGAAISVVNNGNYHLQLFCKSMDERPLFRFDSSGPAHENPENCLLEGMRLPDRQIPTPHFHKVEKNGIEIAFRTPFLENTSNENKVQRDHQFGINHFCQEAKILGPNGEDECVEVKCSSLPLSITIDPLLGEAYPI